MATRTILLKAEAGVSLERVERLSASQKVVSEHYRLRTLRPAQPRVLADLDDAENAFDLEVIASLSDPIVARQVR